MEAFGDGERVGDHSGEARLLLIAGADDVTTVAHRVGYDSSTQFNREYKRQFGSPPGRDAERLRAAPSQVA